MRITSFIAILLLLSALAWCQEEQVAFPFTNYSLDRDTAIFFEVLLPVGYMVQPNAPGIIRHRYTGFGFEWSSCYGD